MPPRLRRLAPGLIGLALATLILWRSGAALEHNAASHEPFMLRVAAPAAVLDSRSEDPSAIQWRGTISPASERERVELRVDDQVVEAQAQAQSEGAELIVPLAQLREQPGWHFVEVRLDRRGGRSERIVDPVLIGQFAQPAQPGQPDPAKPCAAALTVSPALLEGLLVPLLEREVLPQVRAVELMGPGTQITTAKLVLVDDGFEFELELVGINTLGVRGQIDVSILDDRQLHAELAELTEVDFHGKVRNIARGAGAGVGAVVGGVLLGPVGLLGAAAGYYAADKFVTQKSRDLVREQIEQGLAQVDSIELLPSHVELVRGRPGSRVAIGFCEATKLRPTGISAALWMTPDPPAGTPRVDLGVPGPLVTAATLTTEPLAQTEDVRVELSIDAVNALITAWTETGLLTELIGEDRVIERANVQLADWTPLRLAGLRPTRPPVLTPVGGPNDGWRYGLGGLAIAVEGVDAAEQVWGDIYLAAAGTLSPTWDPEAGILSLAGSLDTLALTCAVAGELDDERAEQPAPALHGCFSEVLDAAEVRERIDERLRPGAARLPSFAINELLVDAIGVEIETLELSRPRPGVLRLGAKLRPAPDTAPVVWPKNPWED